MAPYDRDPYVPTVTGRVSPSVLEYAGSIRFDRKWLDQHGTAIHHIVPLSCAQLIDLGLGKPTAEEQAADERRRAENKARARRKGARQVARVARQRARGVRPCTHDGDDR